MHNLDLKWHSFSVDMNSVESYIKANAGTYYVGCTGKSDGLSLHFSQEPSQADKDTCTSYWDGLTSQSTEATEYCSESDRLAAKQSLRDGLDPSKTWDQLTTAERKLVMGQTLTKTDLGL